MSLPDEQARAVLAAEAFLRDLARLRGETAAERRLLLPLVRRARAILRHLPTPPEWAVLLAGGADPDAMWAVFAEESNRRAEALRRPEKPT